MASGDLQVASPPTLKATFLAVQALQLLNFGGDVNAPAVAAFVLSCYNPQAQMFSDSVTNAFDGDLRACGYSDIEATYYALATLSMLGHLNSSQWTGVTSTIANVRYDPATGGFWCRPGVAAAHDSYFALAVLQLLGDSSAVAPDYHAIGDFVAAHQFTNPSQWWQVGGFYNIQNSSAVDPDFADPNAVSAYYCVSALSACGMASAFNAPELESFLNMYRNGTAGTFSLGGGYNIAENVASAYVLALQPSLPDNGQVNYTGAVNALAARLNAGKFNEGYLAPLNHTLAAACEMVWGLNASGVLDELTAATNASLRAFIASSYVAEGSMGGYMPLTDAGLPDIATIATAAVDAGKLGEFNVPALYAYISGTFNPEGPYFCSFGTCYLHCDMPAWVGVSSIDGPLVAGIPATFAGLESLSAAGLLNNFLGSLGGAGAILPNITSAQFLNNSAGAINGAFFPTADWVNLAQALTVNPQVVFPQWTVQALEAIAILDPVAPSTHFNATAAWNYLSQFYTETPGGAWFTPPPYLSATQAQWTADVAAALVAANMSSFFEVAKVASWLNANANTSSLAEVAAYLSFEKVGGAAVPLLPANCTNLGSTQTTLFDSTNRCFLAQGGAWPSRTTVAYLDALRDDRHLYVTHNNCPSSAAVNSKATADITFTSIFAGGVTSLMVTYDIGGMTAPLADQGAGNYVGSISIPNDNAYATMTNYMVTAGKAGWVTATVGGYFLIIPINTPSGTSNASNNSTDPQSSGTSGSPSDPPAYPSATTFSYASFGVVGTAGIGLARSGVVRRRGELLPTGKKPKQSKSV
jgi:hypothetical protein